MNGRSSLRSPQDSPEPKIEDYNSAKVHHGSKLSRERALTTSSYASTAVPPKLETAIPVGQTVFDDDFENMFTGFGERTSSKTPQTRPLTQSPQTRPLTQPPERAFLRAVCSICLHKRLLTVDLENTN